MKLFSLLALAFALLFKAYFDTFPIYKPETLNSLVTKPAYQWTYHERRLVERFARDGHVDALLKMSDYYCYEGNIGLCHNQKVLAARGGNTRAMQELAYNYSAGKDVPTRSAPKAAFWLEMYIALVDDVLPFNYEALVELRNELSADQLKVLEMRIERQEPVLRKRRDDFCSQFPGSLWCM